MLLYNVTTHIEEAANREWMDWMKHTYLPGISCKGLLSESRILRMLNEEDNGGVTYAVQYFFPSELEYSKYLSEHAGHWKSEMEKHFSGRYVTFSTLLEVVL